MAKHTFAALMRRLSRAGFRTDFVSQAILPDWWDENCAGDPDLLPDVEIRVARFLRLPLATIREAGADLSPSAYQGAQLRRARDVDRVRLGPAIHSAMQIAAAVVRNLRDTVPDPDLPPTDGLTWRECIARSGPATALDDILSDLWARGIPVIPIDVIPAPSFQGMACMAEGRPAVLIAHRHDEPGRVAFVVAHEVAHLAAHDCGPDEPVVDVDEDAEIDDAAVVEQLAERFASAVLIGESAPPEVGGSSFRELASRAIEIEDTSGADAGAIVSAWARRTGDYGTATMALKALYRATGARRLLRQQLDRHLAHDSVSESDRGLLRCVHGDPTDETAD